MFSFIDFCAIITALHAKRGGGNMSALSYEGREPYIFVSYAHKDSDKVVKIIEKLVEEGYRVWYDDGIAPGSEWPENIAQHLDGCAVFMAFISNNSNIFSNDLKLKFTLANNPYYSIKSAKMDSTSANIYHIEFQENTEKINIPVEITQTLYITHDKDSFPFVFFTPDNISYKIINQGLRKMTFKPAKQ